MARTHHIQVKHIQGVETAIRSLMRDGKLEPFTRDDYGWPKKEQVEQEIEDALNAVKKSKGSLPDLVNLMHFTYLIGQCPEAKAPEKAKFRAVTFETFERYLGKVLAERGEETAKGVAVSFICWTYRCRHRPPDLWAGAKGRKIWLGLFGGKAAEINRRFRNYNGVIPHLRRLNLLPAKKTSYSTDLRYFEDFPGGDQLNY